jgi:hypothetical protein
MYISKRKILLKHKIALNNTVKHAMLAEEASFLPLHEEKLLKESILKVIMDVASS